MFTAAKPTKSIRLSFFLVIAFFANNLWSQQHEDTVGKHIVEEGETLSSITNLYLGDSFLWRENWRLNPEINDPDLLSPGQELRVIKERKIFAKKAVLDSLSNNVDKNSQKTTWSRASIGDQIIEKDGLRTLRNSSAVLVFNDQSSLRLSEYSQIFLENKSTDLRGHDHGRISLTKGSAELIFENIQSRKKTDIELIAGPSVSRPKPNKLGQARILAAASEEQEGATVMVYEGESSVEAAGQRVALTKGTGTSVPANGPPSPPEKLLAAPGKVLSPSGNRWPIRNQWIKWDTVNSAAKYKVEVCADSDCQQLVIVSPLLVTNSWQPELPAKGKYYARVSAMSASGLQGYPSEHLSFEVTRDHLDQSPPVVAWIPVGYTQMLEGKELIFNRKTQIKPEAFDQGIGVQLIEIKSNNQAWEKWDGDLITASDHQSIQVRATDKLGQVSKVATIEFSSLP